MPRLLSIATIAAAMALATPASALLNRAWVSGRGVDAAGCGPAGNPCRSPQYVHDNIIAAGGEIDIMDPSGYGTLTITKALSVVNDGVGVAGFQQAIAGQNVITISAKAGDAVHLRGLTLDGLGAANTEYSSTAAARWTSSPARSGISPATEFSCARRTTANSRFPILWRRTIRRPASSPAQAARPASPASSRD